MSEVHRGGFPRCPSVDVSMSCLGVDVVASGLVSLVLLGFRLSTGRSISPTATLRPTWR